MKRLLVYAGLFLSLFIMAGRAHPQSDEASYPSPDVTTEESEAEAEIDDMESSMDVQTNDVGND